MNKPAHVVSDFESRGERLPLSPSEQRIATLLSAEQALANTSASQSVHETVAQAFQPVVESPQSETDSILDMDPLQRAVRAAQSAQDLGVLYGDSAAERLAA